MKIKVLNPGISTTIQDSGRVNGLAYGVPKCGWMDSRLAHHANSIVGNPISNPVLEFTLVGGSYQFEDSMTICITGEGNFTLNGVTFNSGVSVAVKRRDVLKVNSNGKGRYSYLAVSGRLLADEYWGSFSTYEFAGKGGYKGRKLQKGDVLEVEKVNPHFKVIEEDLAQRELIRIFPAPETADFSEQDLKQLVSSDFTVAPNSNRMGYRMNEAILEGTKTGNIISSGCIPGTIQVPASGAPIILMADSPTTGGYPRIAVVHPGDLRILAQKLTGEVVRFVWDEL